MQQLVPKQQHKGGSPTNDSSANPPHETERTVRVWCQSACSEVIGKVENGSHGPFRDDTRRDASEAAAICGELMSDEYPSDGPRDKNGERFISKDRFYEEDLVKARAEVREVERWLKDHPRLRLLNRKVHVKKVSCNWKRWPLVMWRCARPGCPGHTGDAIKDQLGDKVNFRNRGFLCSKCEQLEREKLKELGQKLRE